jgi:hypothetical protein
VRRVEASSISTIDVEGNSRLRVTTADAKTIESLAPEQHLFRSPLGTDSDLCNFIDSSHFETTIVQNGHFKEIYTLGIEQSCIDLTYSRNWSLMTARSTTTGKTPVETPFLSSPRSLGSSPRAGFSAYVYSKWRKLNPRHLRTYDRQLYRRHNSHSPVENSLSIYFPNCGVFWLIEACGLVPVAKMRHTTQQTG